MNENESNQLIMKLSERVETLEQRIGALEEASSGNVASMEKLANTLIFSHARSAQIASIVLTVLEMLKRRDSSHWRENYEELDAICAELLGKGDLLQGSGTVFGETSGEYARILDIDGEINRTFAEKLKGNP